MSSTCPGCGSRNTREEQGKTRRIWWCENCWLTVRGVDKQDVDRKLGDLQLKAMLTGQVRLSV